jgi:hypothetical protein
MFLDEIRDCLVPFLRKDNSIVFVFVFGSAALGRTTKESDVDLAVFLDRRKVKDMFQKRLVLMGKIQALLGKNTEVLLLNEPQPTLLKFVIVKEGKLLFERDHGRRVDFELRAMQEYYDFLPFLEEYNKAYVRRSLKENP